MLQNPRQRGNGGNGQLAVAARNIFGHLPWLKRRHGVFVEFGARDGLFESNTAGLEQECGWEGVLIEAGRDYISGLREQRKCHVNRHVGACVWAGSVTQVGRGSNTVGQGQCS